MARILLGVSGGIAAYKALELVRLATAAGHAVRVVQTPASTRFVGTASFAALTGAPVLADEFERDPARGAFPGQPQPDHDPLCHLELVRNADVFAIAPASANTIAKLAARPRRQPALTSAALAATCPLLVAPAMNNHMWEHPATQRERRDAARARRDRARARRRAAGLGRRGGARPPARARRAARRDRGARAGRRGVRARAPLAGVRVLVTAGGTREPIDAVRFVGNRSSGRMGFALAEQAAALGRRRHGRRGERRAAARPARALRRRRDRRASCRRPAPPRSRAPTSC